VHWEYSLAAILGLPALEGALETLVPRFVPLSSIRGGGGGGQRERRGCGRGAVGWREGNRGGAGVHCPLSHLQRSPLLGKCC
jgi:hypothetical protein